MGQDRGTVPLSCRETVPLSWTPLSYTLTRSKRKTLAIYIRNGGVDVRAPLRMPMREIDRFVVSKEKWIRDNLASKNEQAEKRSSFTLDYGDMILYRGKLCPIAQKAGNRAVFDHETFYLPQGLPVDEIKASCIRLYRVLAKRVIAERVQNYADKLSVKPATVKINSAKTRWGSCSAKKSLNFSWRLIMADDDVIDYVVVHELAHIIELNHSKRFWTIVQSILPDYKERQKRLKALQEKFSCENWDS